MTSVTGFTCKTSPPVVLFNKPFQRILSFCLVMFAILRASSARSAKQYSYYNVDSKGVETQDLLQVIKCQIWPNPSCSSLDKSFPVNQLEQNLWSSVRSISIPSAKTSCGNKAKHLEEQRYLKTLLNVPGWDVPEPYCVEEISVESLLKAKAPKVFENWQKIIDKNPGRDSFANDPEIRGLLEEIQTEITRVFLLDEASSLLGIDQKMGDWLKEKEKLGHFLVVRSSGAEDTHEVVNAGGNLSEVYVKPNIKDVSLAVGRVVASYFGKDSIQNRINAKADPFTKPLHLGVLVQEMIGEEVGGSKDPNKIPISFVMFTNELSYTQEDPSFRVLTISAAPGQGKGVVESVGVASDTILVMRSEFNPSQIHYLYDLQEKLVRQSPVEENGTIVLKNIQNPSEMVSKRLFNSEQIATLYSLAMLIESFYDYPHDIEGVFLDGIFYFVQARPIKRVKQAPTYLDFEHEKSLKVYPITLGRASVLQIQNKDQIKEASSLKAAEEGFIESFHQAAVVSEKESSKNSHAVVNFKGLGAPSFYSPENPSAFLSQINEEKFLVIDTQKGIFHLWDRSKPLQEHIKKGFVEHPAELSQTFSEANLPISKKEEINSPLMDLLASLLKARTKKEYFFLLDQFKEMPELVSLSLHIDELKSYEKKVPQLGPYLKTLESLRSEVLYFLEEAYAAVKASEDPSFFTSMKNLFLVKALKTFALGNPDSSGIGSYSLQDVQSLIESAHELISYQKKLSHKAHFAELFILGKQTSQEAFTQWKKFLLDLENLVEKKKITIEDVQRFKEIISLLDSTKNLPFFLVFSQAALSKDSVTRFRQILKSIPPSEETTLKILIEKHKYSKHLQKQLEGFADPNTFEESLKTATKHLEEVSSLEFLADLKRLSPIGKMVALEMMRSSVDLVDLAAKEVKGASNVQVHVRLKNFQKVLLPYFAMMKTWAQTLIPDELENWNNGQKYFETIREILSDRPNESSQLRPSRDFSVSAAMIGSETNFERHYPKTLEDILTLIHQNSLMVISTYYQKELAGDMQSALLPKDFLEALSKIKKVYGKSPYQIHQTGIEIKGKGVLIRFNIPLRNHGAGLEVYYDFSSQTIEMKSLFLGQARGRWEILDQWFSSLDQLIYKEQYRQKTEQEFIASWIVPFDQVETVTEELVRASRFSIYEDSKKNFVSSCYENWKSKRESISLIKHVFKRGSPLAVNLLTSFMQDYNISVRLKEELINSIESEIENYNNVDEQEFYVEFLHFLFMQNRKSIEEVFLGATSGFSKGNTNAKTQILRLFQTFVQEGQGYSEAIQVASQGMRDSNQDIRANSLELFGSLIQKGQGYSEAIQVASQGILDSSALVQYKAFKFFEFFIFNGLGCVEAAQTAVLGSSHLDSRVRDISMNLFGFLVHEEKSYVEAIEAASKGMFDSDWDVRWSSLRLFKILIHKKQGYDKATQMAMLGISHLDSGLREISMNLFEILVEEEQSYAQAIEAAAKGMFDSEETVRKLSLELFKALIHKKQGYDKATQMAVLGSSHLDSRVRDISMNLFRFLVREGKSYVEAIEAASKGMFDSDWDVRWSSLELFKTLIQKKQGYSEVTQTAMLGSRHLDSNVRESSMNLFRFLVHEGKSYVEAIEAAAKGMFDSEEKVRRSSLLLFETLIRKGQGYNEAIESASTGIFSSNSCIRNKSIDLFKLLVEQGQIYKVLSQVVYRMLNFNGNIRASSNFPLNLLENDKQN